VAVKLRLIQARTRSGGALRDHSQESSELPLTANTLAENPWEKPFAKMFNVKPAKKVCKRAIRKKSTGPHNLMAGIVARADCGVKRKGYKILW